MEVLKSFDMDYLECYALSTESLCSKKVRKTVQRLKSQKKLLSDNCFPLSSCSVYEGRYYTLDHILSASMPSRTSTSQQFS